MPLRRALLAGVLAAILCAAPAAALRAQPCRSTRSTPSSRRRRITIPTGLRRRTGCRTAASTRRLRPDHVRPARVDGHQLSTQPQALVELFVRRSGSVRDERHIRITACGPIRLRRRPRRTQAALDAAAISPGLPVTLGDPAGAATIRSVIIDSAGRRSTSTTSARPATLEPAGHRDHGRAARDDERDDRVLRVPRQPAGRRLHVHVRRVRRVRVAGELPRPQPWRVPVQRRRARPLGAHGPDARVDGVHRRPARRGRRRRSRRVRQLPVRREPGADGHRRRQDRRRVRGAAVR